ncbi:MAG: 4-hydroxythreonine-4-phosphate dehydrogenase PdxA [candidate division NC10 bacterium RBG_16_65_8]|nr:MAG: 4-hydroxythreonine-4-phosphate dehydrogenase PdxA [candidate division NC10 bacterium RBG_16_65_8]
MGDPASIGPEISAKALAEADVYAKSRSFVLGDTRVMADTLRITKLPLTLHPIAALREARFTLGTLDVLDFSNVDMAAHHYGKVSAMCGKASVEYIEKGIALALAKEIDAVVTGPIHKESINQAGCPHPGHTEIFGNLTNTKDYAMMLIGEDLRVVHVSTHVSLRQAIERTKKPRVLTVIRLANRALKALGIAEPKIAVAGLNPHAGEHGLFGDEEIHEIIPAIEEARSDGIEVDGPIAPDTVFGRARGGLYDIVVCMYHDQGHIPLKTLGFTFDRATQKWTSVSGVNVTLGLPIIRTSVDHGTAFGKAGKGTAAHQSMLDAIDVAVKLAEGRKAGLLA